MMPIISVLALHIAWKSDFVVYVLALVQADPAAYAGLLPSFIVLGGEGVLPSKSHTSAKTMQQDGFVLLCCKMCKREKINVKTHTHAHTQTVKKNS